MAKTMTQYDLLISCPSDVIQELNIIKETVETFNNLWGSVNNVRIETHHWSTDSFPKSGDKPQKILNDQFVLSCDAAVAVFWTRFGMPTDEYGSGTEEEVEELIKSGKQVFLYFSDCPANPSTIDHDQYKKILAFREKYKNKGLYGAYSNLDDFKKDFLNHLSIYFLKLLDEGSSQRMMPSRSRLCIKGVNDGLLTDKLELFNANLLNSLYMVKLKESILGIFDEIKSIKLTVKEIIINQSEDIIGSQSKASSALLALQEQIKSIKPIGGAFSSEPVTVDECKEVIGGFAQQNNIDLQKDFYYLGELTTIPNFVGGGSYGLGPSASLSGSDDEKRKYKLIRKLRQEIDEYNQSTDYFSEIDAKVYLTLALCNIGSDYDEDIDVKLYVQKGCLCIRKQLPTPGDEILEMANKIFEWIYKPKKTVLIDEFGDYKVISRFPSMSSLGMLGTTTEDKINKERTAFKDNQDVTFCYEYFEDTEYDILCFNQKYLKQNTNSYFPSHIVFNNSTPGIIKYQITSKRCPDVVKGELACEQIN